MESLDWSTEWLTSLVWTLGVFVAALIVLGLVAVLLVRLTTWGRQFWRLAGPYVWPGRGERASWRPTLFILLLLLLVVLSVRLNLLLSYNTNELYTALQDLDAAAFWRAIGIFAVLAALYVAQALVTYFVGQAFLIRLWENLNGRFLGDWLGDRVYHRSRFSSTQVDNPDQRIQEDITSFAQTSFTLSFGPNGAVSALITIPSFTIVLWDLSGPLSVFGLEIPRAMTFIAFVPSSRPVRRRPGRSRRWTSRTARAESLLVTGRSGTGKTTLLRSFADLWPYAEGTVERPVGPGAVFLSQQPYLPLGSLRTALAYPAAPESVSDDDAARVLRATALGHLVDRVDDEELWWRTLSPGEQQRVGFARLLIARPDVVFLDEATAALDEGLEHELYTLLRAELPDLVLVSVGHRSSLEAFHARRLDLEGEGAWGLRPM